MLIEAALQLARQRHAALKTDDLDAFAGVDAEMAAHCLRLIALEPRALSAADLASLDELLALETASLRTLAVLSEEVAGRLSHLAARARTNTAYLRAERSSVNPL